MFILIRNKSKTILSKNIIVFTSKRFMESNPQANAYYLYDMWKKQGVLRQDLLPYAKEAEDYVTNSLNNGAIFSKIISESFYNLGYELHKQSFILIIRDMLECFPEMADKITFLDDLNILGPMTKENNPILVAENILDNLDSGIEIGLQVAYSTYTEDKLITRGDLSQINLIYEVLLRNGNIEDAEKLDAEALKCYNYVIESLNKGAEISDIILSSSYYLGHNMTADNFVLIIISHLDYLQEDKKKQFQQQLISLDNINLFDHNTFREVKNYRVIYEATSKIESAYSALGVTSDSEVLDDNTSSNIITIALLTAFSFILIRFLNYFYKEDCTSEKDSVDKEDNLLECIQENTINVNELCFQLLSILMPPTILLFYQYRHYYKFKLKLFFNYVKS